MDQRYGKLLFDQLRVMAYIPGDAPITDDTLAMVITLNENLLQFLQEVFCRTEKDYIVSLILGMLLIITARITVIIISGIIYIAL